MEIAGVEISHPDKVLFPDSGITKQQLAEYYNKVSELMLPYIIDRPVSLVRSPGGIEREQFYQKHPQESFPEYIDRVKVKEGDGETGVYISLDAVNDLIYLSNLSVIEYHSWGAKANSLEKPDTIVFDLDPSPKAPWDYSITIARDIRDKLENLGLDSFVKTSGKKGLHIMVPLTGNDSWDDVRDFSEQFAKKFSEDNPEEATTEFYKDKRGNRVFIDWLRNVRGSTSVSAYSVRAYEGATVSMPIDWDEVVPSMMPNQYNITNAFRRLSSIKNDPWEKYLNTRQSLPAGWKN